MDLVQSTQNYSTNKGGFTLVELIVSIAIISILLIAGASILSTTFVTISDEGQDTHNLYQAKEVMEKLLSGVSLSMEDFDKVEWSSEDKSIDGVEGTYHEVKEKGTNKIILKGFLPKDSVDQ